MPEARIDVVIGSAQAQSGANALNRAVDGIRSNFIDLAAKAFVVDRAFAQIWTHAKQGAQFEETMARLNRQTGVFHTNAHVLVGDLQSISQHTLSIDKAATLASRALAIGLNPDQIRTFTQAADLLKEQMGTDLPAAFDNLTQAAITGRGAVLAQIGVYVDLDEEIKKLAVSTNRTTEQITKQEKAMLMTKAMAGQVESAHARLGDSALSDAKKLEQLETRFDELTLSMNRGFKTAIIESIDWLDQLGQTLARLERFKPSNMAAPYIRAKGLDAGQSGNPVWEEVMGRAIVQDTLGNLARQRDSAAASQTIPKLPTSLQGSQLDAARERRERGIQGELERTKAGLDAAGRLFEIDAQQQLITQEDLVSAKGALRLRELAKTGETLNRQKQMEEEFYEHRVAIGFESTEERITAEETYRSKVFDINQSILANVQAFSAASTLSIEEKAAARAAAEQRLGQRLTESAKSNFDIQESLRRQDLEDAQTYYQGEFDMAVARFAGDQEIATKERQLLREQLAFKLRLTQEEVDRILFLRGANDFEGVRQIAGRADPSLNPRAIEGIIESGKAKDIRLAERANGDFFAGWARGLQDYTQRTENAFNLSNDMARRTAQTMEQGFQKFFFDGMEGNFNSFKDVLSSVLDFTKQIVSQIAAQMVTVGIVKPGAEALSGFFSRGATTSTAGTGASVPKFASGGTGNFGSGTLAMLHGNEGIVPLPDGRSIPVTMRMPSVAPQTNVSVSVQVINKVSDAQVSVQRNTGGGGKEEIMILIEQAVDKNISQGRHDRSLGQRFGVTAGRG